MSSTSAVASASATLSPRSRRVLILGYPGVGKSTITKAFLKQHDDISQGAYEPTIGTATETTTIKVFNVPYELEVIDTSGLYENTPIDPQLCISVDGFVVVYSVDDITSFETARKIANQVLARAGLQVPIVLVGNKTDLRRQVSDEDGTRAANAIGGVHIDACAVKGTNVDSIFEQVLVKICERRGEVPEKGRGCKVM